MVSQPAGSIPGQTPLFAPDLLLSAGDNKNGSGDGVNDGMLTSEGAKTLKKLKLG